MNKNNLVLIGDCTNENLVNEIFGSVSEFARHVEQSGNESSYGKYGKYQIKYNPKTDIHSFWIKN